jgi:phytoene synthase
MNALAVAELDAAYRHCRRLNSRHGKTFYLATALLPPAKRPAIHALYGFARFADDLVDRPDPGRHPGERLADLRAEVEDVLSGGRGRHPVVRAMADTVQRYAIDRQYIADFLASMAADLTVTRYQTFEDLRRYMWGSAAVIGLQVLPVLGVADPGSMQAAERHAAELGVAFQLTNFLRDVGEDYRRGRIYLPSEELRAHGVREVMLSRARSSDELKSLISAQVARAREWYERAVPGIELLAPDARDCVRTANVLYGEILDEIQRADYDVLIARATVSRRRRAVAGLRGYSAAWTARRKHRRLTDAN